MGTKKNILIAEDDQEVMRYLQRGLIARRRMFYNTYVCIDGLEALESMITHDIDCLILDLNMNNLNGIEVLQQMQRSGQLERTTVIISSGFLDESMEEQLRSFNIRHYLRKPYELSTLIKTIDEILLPQNIFEKS